jgi:hypothetical protein
MVKPWLLAVDDNTVILWDVNFEDLLVRGCDQGAGLFAQPQRKCQRE